MGELEAQVLGSEIGFAPLVDGASGHVLASIQGFAYGAPVIRRASEGPGERAEMFPDGV